MNIGSLFSGVGGLELGLEQAGVGEVVFQAEIDPVSDIYRHLILPKNLEAYDRSTGAERRRLQALAADQWFTDPQLAIRIADWARPQGFVLEPSAGHGALANACRAAGCDVTTVDIEAEFQPDIVGDYLKLKFSEPFQWIVMNSPYAFDADLLHLEKALTEADDVVALVRLNALAGSERYRRLWQHVTLAGLVILAGRPSFKLVDEDVGSPRHDFCVVHVTMRENVVPKPVEWWQGDW